jgi:hypothetical protein
MLTIKVQASTIGDTTVIPGVANKKIRVLAYLLTSSNQNMVKWKSGSTEISGELHMPTGGNLVIHMGDLWPSGGLPALECAIGESLVINLNSAQSIGGHITYYYVGA